MNSLSRFRIDVNFWGRLCCSLVSGLQTSMAAGISVRRLRPSLLSLFSSSMSMTEKTLSNLRYTQLLASPSTLCWPSAALHVVHKIARWGDKGDKAVYLQHPVLYSALVGEAFVNMSCCIYCYFVNKEC